MDSWWSGMSNFEHLYWGMAVAASLILAIQLVLACVSGLEFHAGSDFGTHHGGDNVGEPHFQLMTIRTVVAFFTLMGWTGLAFDHQGFSKLATIGLSMFCGFMMMWAVASLFFLMSKLQCEGNTDYSKAVGLTGTVYISIPPNKTGQGRINVVVNGRKVEMNAVTSCETMIQTGREIKIKELNNHIAVVERI